MAQKRIRVGIIGANISYGWGSGAHLPALLALPEYQLTAVCTAHPESARESAQKFGARLAFHDYRELVTSPQVDLVSVAVRVPTHHALVMAALNAGKHVFCEWPLGANTAEAEEMANLARSKGVTTMVGLQSRGSPAILRIRELLQEGYVGRVLSAHMTSFSPALLQRNSQRAWMADRSKGANTFTIAGGHSIDAFCFCLGGMAELSALVSTQVKQWHLTDTKETIEASAPDSVMVNGRLADGALASIHIASVPWHSSGWRMEIYGTEGTIIASSAGSVQMADIRLQGAKGSDKALQELPVPNKPIQAPGEVPRGSPFNVAQLFRRLSEAILKGKPAEPDFSTAVRLHKLLDTIQLSSDTERRLKVS